MKHLFSLLALLFAFNVEAQRKTFYASDFPELTQANGTKQVRDLYPTIERAKERYPSAYKWWTGVSGQSDATFLTMDLIPACWNEAVWAGNGSGYAAGVQCTSRNNVDFSGVNGQYMVNVACRVFQGRYVGAGTSIGLNGNASTELIYDAARWQDFAPIRAVILSANWGTDTYLESLLIDGFRVNGRAPGWLTGQEQHGIALRMLGETARVQRSYISDNNGEGLWINGAGPGHVEQVTCFDNNGAGLLYTNDKSGDRTGNSLGMLTVIHCSFDNNARQILNQGGGAMALFYIKSEYGLSLSRGKPDKAGPVIEAHGFVDITANHITDSHGNVATGAAFVMNSTSNRSRFTVNHYTQVAGNGNVNTGRSALLADVRSKQVWSTSDPNLMKFNPLTIDWRGSGNSSTITCTEPLVSKPFNGTTRLGVSTSYAGYDYAAGTPVWNPAGGTVTPPVTPPCAYTYSPWGLCSGGKKSRTVIGTSPNPCAGTPVLDTVCTSTSAKYTYTSTSRIAANTCVTLTTPVAGVTRARITLDVTALPTGYAKIMGDGTTSLQTKDGTGELWWAGKKVGVKLIKGKNTYDIPLPNVTITCLFQQKCPGGGALVGTYESIELY